MQQATMMTFIYLIEVESCGSKKECRHIAAENPQPNEKVKGLYKKGPKL